MSEVPQDSRVVRSGTGHRRQARERYGSPRCTRPSDWCHWLELRNDLGGVRQGEERGSARIYIYIYIYIHGSSYFGSKGRDGPLVLGGETARLRGGSEAVGPKGGRSSPWTLSFPPPPASPSSPTTLCPRTSKAHYFVVTLFKILGDFTLLDIKGGWLQRSLQGQRGGTRGRVPLLPLPALGLGWPAIAQGRGEAKATQTP